MDGKIFVELENLVYKQDNQLLSLANEVSFRGFITKVNNFYNNLDKFISQQNAQIQKLELEITELKSITGDNTPKHKRKDYLEALREDNGIVMEETEKMSKQKDYKISFVTKSAKILEELNNISQNFLVKIKQVDDNIIKISVTKNLLFKICIKNLYNIYFKVKSIYNA